MSELTLKTSAKDLSVPERFDPATMRGEIIEAEHLARYRWAAAIAPGRRVLDAGCGTGYGSLLLAEAGALEVTGVDRAVDVLVSAREKMPATVVLEEGDVTALPYEDGRFDLIVCFEVIEHLENPSDALDEFRRLLSPSGVLALSSPNRAVYPPGNPHHVHEYTPDELEAELTSRFTFASLRRQHTWITSGVLDDEQFRRSDDASLGDDVAIRKLGADQPGAELYTLGLAGEQQLPDPSAALELSAAVELRRWDALWHEQSQLLTQQQELLTAHEQVFVDHAVLVGQLQREIHLLRGQLARTESQLARMPELDAQLQDLLQTNDELLALNHQLQRRQQHLAELETTAARYTVLVESSSWRLTSPLRRAGALLRRLAG